MAAAVILLSGVPAPAAADCPNDVEPASPVLLGHATDAGYQLAWTDLANGPLGLAVDHYDVFRSSAEAVLDTDTPIATLGASAHGYLDAAVPSSGDTVYWVVASLCQDRPAGSNL